MAKYKNENWVSQNAPGYSTRDWQLKKKKKNWLQLQ